MNTLRRRSFLKQSALAVGAGLALRATPRAWSRPVGSNEDVRVGVIGVGRKGSDLVEKARQCRGVRLAAVCDVDPRVLAQQVDTLGQQNLQVFSTTDAQALLAREDVDAVIIASPNHWHALHTVWACEAGKDVYVEKPASHSIWEGVQMGRAAHRHRRVVQVGTQKRSDLAMPEVIHYLREGNLGRILWVHAVCYKGRAGIGRRQPWYPDWLDYDRFCGPAPMVPLVRDELHYDWHWYWDTGNGDLANIGIHEFDIARWVAGHEGAPRRILSLGGRFAFVDAGETPNTQLTVFDYAGAPIFLENRVLPAKSGVKFMDHVQGVRQGIYVQCEGGSFAGQHGGVIFDREGRKVKTFTGDGGRAHLDNFFGAVRSRRVDTLAAPLETGRVSTSACLYGNISYRLGQPTSIGAAHSALGSVPSIAPLLEGLAKHLEANGVDLTEPRLTMGPWIEPDTELAMVNHVEGGGADAMEQARFLLKGAQRPPYVLAG